MVVLMNHKSTWITFLEAYKEYADEIIDYLNADPDYITSDKKNTTDGRYLWRKCGENLKRINGTLPQEILLMER